MHKPIGRRMACSKALLGEFVIIWHILSPDYSKFQISCAQTGLGLDKLAWMKPACACKTRLVQLQIAVCMHRHRQALLLAQRNVKRFAETNSTTPWPVWCSGCNFKAPDGDDDPNEVQCEACRLEPGKITMIPDPNMPLQMSFSTQPGGECEYEFKWPECVQGIVHDTLQVASQTFCMAIHEANEANKCVGTGSQTELYTHYTQIGNIHPPFYIDPDHPEHTREDV
ncbi:hypothetical protein GGX14DRAFT_408572 [Mycena pura]|uniref:Uncharacterized protein n=1 Tax=Mycena pura TaxID=153505 RepID=A0AAD6XXN1_9AGAR|nr:hypothetical protein GGX14DRAFT_408572 [Mycena pura]